MGLGQLFSRGPRRFVDDGAMAANIDKQRQMTPATLEQLRQLGVDEDRELRLEYFFYTDASTKASNLASAVAALGYQVDSGKAAGDSRLHIVTGWTIPLKMDVATVSAWAEQMCRLGFEHDAEFDGWGTNPNQ